MHWLKARPSALSSVSLATSQWVLLAPIQFSIQVKTQVPMMVQSPNSLLTVAALIYTQGSGQDYDGFVIGNCRYYDYQDISSLKEHPWEL